MVENIYFSNGTIEYKQGTHANLILRMSANSQPLDMSGYSAKLIIQKSYQQPITEAEINAIFDTTTTDEFMLFEFVPSTLSATVLVSDFQDMVYQIKITNSRNEVSIPIRGAIKLYKELS